ncbi:CLUMA_CG006613, isoform A [Clunio marinus]|uniref:CLUMA_CG006613, isoform A n=1 Tax=Clunio marinus TaxID=568069 RepID=A0A1J1I2N7_9DIPT|nr:CLUMA_CG006613, isoform A [Clunio marinus]
MIMTRVFIILVSVLKLCESSGIKNLIKFEFISDNYSTQSYTVDNLYTILQNPKFDRQKQTAIYSYGFTQTVYQPSVRKIVEAYLANSDFNFILVNYNSILAYNIINANNFGVYIASSLEKLFNNGYGNFHVIGFSLGAQISGAIGRSLIKISKGRHIIPRITGLDPGQIPPFFGGVIRNLNAGDALFVDIIHGESKFFGSPMSVGNVSFWINGGYSQPSCTSHNIIISSICSHLMTPQYWAASVQGKNYQMFPAYKCSNYYDFKFGRCDKTPVAYMGLYVDQNLNGKFYLDAKINIYKFSRFLLLFIELIKARFNKELHFCNKLIVKMFLKGFISALLLGALFCDSVSGQAEDIRFRFYFGANQWQFYDITNIQTIVSHPSFSSARNTVFYHYGFTQTENTDTVRDVINSYLQVGNVNIVLIYYTSVTTNAITNARELGGALADCYIRLADNGFPISRLHLVGFSLGAQIQAFASRNVQGRTNNRLVVGRLTGLDPGQIQAPLIPLVGRLSSSDAAFVDSVHTEGVGFGDHQSIGHISFALTVFGIFAVASAMPFTEEQKQKAQNYIEKCIQETGVSPEIVQKLKAGDFSNEEEKTQNFALCFFREAGFVDDQGNQQLDVIIEKLSAGNDTEQAKAVVEKCKDVTGTTPSRRFNKSCISCEKDTLRIIFDHEVHFWNIFGVRWSQVITEYFYLFQALTEEQKLKVDEHTKICAEEVGLEYESGVKYRFSVIEDNTDSAKKFVKCFFIRTGFMNEDGVLQKDVMLEKISLGKDDEAKAKISAVIENCTALSVLSLFSLIAAFQKDEIKEAQDRHSFLTKITKECTEETGLSLDDAQKLLLGDLSLKTNEAMCFVRCIFQREGFLDTADEPQVGYIAESLAESSKLNRKALLKILKKCSSFKYKDPCESAFKGSPNTLATKLEEFRIAFQGHIQHCAQEIGVTKDVVLRMTIGDFSVNDQKTQCFVGCFFKRMKFCVAVFLVSVAFSTVAGQIIRRFTVRQATRQCIAETGISYDTAVKFSKGDFSEDTESAKCFLKCFAYKIKFVSPEGEFQKEELLKYVNLVASDSIPAGEIIDTCKNDTKRETDECDFIFRAYKCFWDGVRASEANAARFSIYNTFEFDRLQDENETIPNEMKVLAIIILCFTLSISAQTHKKSIAFKAIRKCAKEHEIDYLSASNFIKGDFSKANQATKCFLKCVANDMEFWINEKPQKTNMMNYVDLLVKNSDGVSDIIDSCIENDVSDDFCEHLYNVYKCFWSKAIVPTNQKLQLEKEFHAENLNDNELKKEASQS